MSLKNDVAPAAEAVVWALSWAMTAAEDMTLYDDPKVDGKERMLRRNIQEDESKARATW